MPPQLGDFAEDLISLKESKKVFYLLRKDRYMIKATRSVYISSSILRGSIFICTI